MKNSFILRLALKNLLGRKLRTLLTIIGVSISVGFVCLLMAFSYGMQRAATDQIANGETLKNIDVSGGSSRLVGLDNDAINAISEFSEVDKIYPQVALAGDAQISGSKADGVIYGTDKDLLNIIKPNMISGSLYSQDASDVVVLNSTLARKLTNNEPETLVGQVIELRLVLRTDLFTDITATNQIKSIKATVTGITDDGKTSYAFVPLKTVTNLGVDRYSSFKVQLKKADDVAKVKAQIDYMGLKTSAVKDTVDQVNQFFQVFQMILISVGAISVIVATLGIFNTMTISLIEKTREVGLMKILGVKKIYIRRIFMTEALIIGLAGGSIGIAGSIAIGQAVNYVIYTMAIGSGNLPATIMYFPVLLVMLIMVVAIFISLLAGLYPARRTTKISPLDALRYE
jgi:ABC-type antimicrobial peptide transport system permease subunit